MVSMFDWILSLLHSAIPKFRTVRDFYRLRPFLAFVALAATFFAQAPLDAQTVNRVARDADLTALQTLPNHHPQWANPSNDVGLVPPDQKLDHLTLILSR